MLTGRKKYGIVIYSEEGAVLPSHKIYAENQVDFPAECRLRYVKSDNEKFSLHTHDYYEIFLTLDDIVHIINGREETLSAGTLTFIRDFDEHTYKVPQGSYKELINFAFTENTYSALAGYLGEKFEKKGFLKCKNPPQVKLSFSDTDYVKRKFLSLNAAKDAYELKYRSRLLLVSLFTKFFIHSYDSSEKSVPTWLEMFFDEISSPEFFTGEDRDISAVSGKSREHTQREFKKYYKITPGEYINSRRLNFAQNLLLTSDLSVLEVAFESGFSNLSWFNELFRRTYGITPLQYRILWKKGEEIT